jgi:DNA-binding NarL/FixJ family response regulator
MIRIVLVDDHGMVREGLRVLLGQQADLEIVGEAGDVPTASDVVAATQPDVVLIDVGLGEADGVPLIGALSDRAPESRVLVLSMFTDGETVRQALLAGAAGYLVKGASVSELVEAIRAVAAGRTYLHSSIAGIVLDDGLRWLRAGVPLSPREREVLSLLAAGRPAERIAGVLGISTNTVRRHLANVTEKLGIHGHQALARYAVDHGYARPRPAHASGAPEDAT